MEGFFNLHSRVKGPQNGASFKGSGSLHHHMSGLSMFNTARSSTVPARVLMILWQMSGNAKCCA